jgi:hypothetical protein
MPRFLNGFWRWAEAYGTARAAAHLTRLGMWREAQTLVRNSK